MMPQLTGSSKMAAAALGMLLGAGTFGCSTVPPDDEEATTPPPPALESEPALSPGLSPAPSSDSSANAPRPEGVEPMPSPMPDAGEEQLRDSVRLGPVLELPTVQDTAR